MNVPPRAAFPTLPTLPKLSERVDPDAWLATLDQKMYLRHAGRDGCFDVDLATYYMGPQVAGCSVLLQVEAQSPIHLTLGQMGEREDRKLQIWQTTRKQKRNKELSDERVQLTPNGRR